MKKLIIVLSTIAIAACVTGYDPSYRFNEIQVLNLSGSTIEDVNVRVIDSEKALSCDKVAKNAICDDRFGTRRFPQQGIELSWTHPDGNRKSEVLTPKIPITLQPVIPLRIVMEVNEDGSVNPFFEQDSRGRR